jgi:hypothetical protein
MLEEYLIKDYNILEVESVDDLLDGLRCDWFDDFFKADSYWAQLAKGYAFCDNKFYSWEANFDGTDSWSPNIKIIKFEECEKPLPKERIKYTLVIEMIKTTKLSTIQNALDTIDVKILEIKDGVEC